MTKIEVTGSLEPLHKQGQPVQILGQQVLYYKPNLAQVCYLFNLFIKGIFELCPEEDKAQATTIDDKFSVSAKHLAKLSKEQDSTEYNSFIGSIFATGAMNEFMFPCIKQCFPGTNPVRMTTPAIIACMEQIMGDFFTTMQGAADTMGRET